MEPIQVRGSQDGVAVATQFAIALIVTHDEDDVRPASGETTRWGPRGFSRLRFSGCRRGGRRCEHDPEPDPYSAKKFHGSGCFGQFSPGNRPGV